MLIYLLCPSFCERCLIGYYGNPILGEEQVACRECPCPGTKASGHSYAETCYLDKASNQPVCDCSEGFAGRFQL
jgi:laminin beta 1